MTTENRVDVPAARYRVSVPVVLDLEVESTIGPAETLAAVVTAFQRDDDPLLGANVKVQRSIPVAPRLEIVIARTRGAELITGVRAFRPTLTEAKE